MPWDPQHKLETREKVLTSAAKLFTHQGYDQVGINDVMAEAGLTRGVFYKYFSSKAELYSEAILKAEQDSQHLLSSNCDSEGHFLERAQRYLSPQHRSGEKANCPLAFLITDIVHRDEDVRDTYTAAFRRFTAQLSKQGDTIDDMTNQQAIQSAVIMIGGLAISRAINDDELAQQILLSCHQLLETEALSK